LLFEGRDRKVVDTRRTLRLFHFFRQDLVLSLQFLKV
jgi:hypothetical protein